MKLCCPLRVGTSLQVPIHEPPCEQQFDLPSSSYPHTAQALLTGLRLTVFRWRGCAERRLRASLFKSLDLHTWKPACHVNCLSLSSQSPSQEPPMLQQLGEAELC